MAQKFTVPITIKNLSSAGSDGITVFLDQESFARLKVEAGGRITWGTGAGAGDTNLYRDEANILKTDDTFKSAGLFVAGTQIDPTGATIGDALVFNGTKFVSASVAGGGGGTGNASLTVSDTPPTGAEQGDLWFESDTGKTFVYYDLFWVEVGSGGAVTAADSISGLSDVAFSTLSNGDFFRYNSSASVWTNDAINLSTDTIGDYVQSLVAGTGISLSNNSGEGTTPTVSLNATLDNLSDTTVPSPASGDYLKWNGTAWVNDPINLGTDTVGGYVASLVAGTGVTLADNSGEGATPTIAIGQAVGTSASVQFAAVTAPLIGNASTASALETARTISLTGDVSGSASFNGSANASITTTIQPNSVALGTDTTGDYVSSLVAGAGITLTNNSGESATPTIAVNSDAIHTTQVKHLVKNDSGVTLTKGTVVYTSGANGTNILVKKAQANAESTSAQVLGFVESDMAVNAIGYVVTSGLVADINTNSAAAAGDPVWLSATTAGGVVYGILNKPYGPNHLVYLGVVTIKNANTGEIFVHINNGWELDELHSVDLHTSEPVSGDFLKYNGTVWVNDPINLGTDTVGNYMSGVSAGTGIAVSHTPGEGSTATISIESTAWTAYTPTITADGGGFALNNGTLTGRYKQIGKTVFFSLKFLFGSTTSAGTGHWNFSLPVTAYDPNFTFSAAILDNTISWYGGIGNGNYTGSTSNFAVIIPGTSASVTTWATVGNGGPFIWGAGDNITITGSYEAA